MLLRVLNPLITGWGMYFRHAMSSKIFGKLDNYIWEKLWKWARRRHPNKGRKWVKAKYYGVVQGRKWTFRDHKGAYIRRLSQIATVRHIKVRDTFSKDDPELVAYWLQRAGQDNPEMGVRAAIFKKQKGLCLRCGDWLERGEEVNKHHLDGNRSNNRLSNLELVHETCHHQITTETRRTA